MRAENAAGLGLGVVFGFMLCWSGMVDPDVIRGALLFEESYLFLFMGSAVGTAAIGVRLVRRFRTRAVLVDHPIGWSTQRPAREHIVGSMVFGLGWGVSGACPGPIAAQVGQGIGWALLTLTGVVVGIRLFHAGAGRRETEPATEVVAPAPA